MNPLHPSPHFLHRLALMVAEARDAQIRRWAEAIDRRFSAVSIVKTYRGGRLSGYEVWRHLYPKSEDPARHKARLWFGLGHWHSELGYHRAALDMARKAARKMATIPRRELRAWWATRQRRRKHLLPLDLLEVRLDYTDLQRMSHRFQER